MKKQKNALKLIFDQIAPCDDGHCVTSHIQNHN